MPYKMDFVCEQCQAVISREGHDLRPRKRFCDQCLRERVLARLAARNPRPKPPPGVCPDCGGASSLAGRRCIPCGRRHAGESKTAGAKRKYEAQRRTTLVLLREYGRRHGGVGPTMAVWDELGYYGLLASQVLVAFDGWLAALDAAGLEHPTSAHSPRGRVLGPGRLERNRQMVTGGILGGKSPRGDAPEIGRPPWRI